MLRRVFAFISVLSLLLCLSACGLWVRSQYVLDQVIVYPRTAAHQTTPHGFCAAVAMNGNFWWSVSRGIADGPEAPWAWMYDHHDLHSQKGRNLAEAGEINVLRRLNKLPLGIQYGSFPGGAQSKPHGRLYKGVQSNLIIPLWLICVITAPMPMFHAMLLMRARRHARRGKCPRCGYDLRATPGRCPECGTVRDADAGEPRNHEDAKTTRRESLGTGSTSE